MTKAPSHGFWIQTHTGMAFDLLDPKPGMVALDDIAHALARLCRFTGHCSRHYSVAEHSVFVAARCVDEFHCPPEWALAALLHDATEAYIGDLSSPLKALLRAKHPPSDLQKEYGIQHSPLDEIESRIKQAIADHFGTDIRRKSSYSSAWRLDDEAMAARRTMIKNVDLRMLATERRDLMPVEPKWDESGWLATGHPMPLPYEDLRISVTPSRTANHALKLFKRAFSHYGGKP